MNILITGAAKRIGAACARYLHDQGNNLLLHYHQSELNARQLCLELNTLRPNTAMLIQGDLARMEDLENIAKVAKTSWDGITALVNNASTFYPTPIGHASELQWDDLLGCNLKAPFFLSQLLADSLAARTGCIVNIVDIHAQRGLPNHSIYCIAKAGLEAMTRILAKELGPGIRVNAVAPGAILWPEAGLSESEKESILARIPLQRCGSAEDVAQAVHFLIENAGYVTGQIIAVDGGRLLFS